MRDVGVGEHRVLAHHEQALEASVEHGAHGLGDGQARRVGQLDAPRRRELRPRRRVGHLLVAGVVAGQGSHVAGALHVVLTAHRVDAGARPAEVAGQQGQVGDRQHVLGAVRVLGDAHRVDDRRGGGAAVQARGLDDLVGRHARDLGDELRRVRRRASRRNSSKPSVRAAMNSSSASPSRRMTCMRPLTRRHVGARSQLQVQVGEAHEVDLARIGDDQLGALAHGALDVEGADRVRLGGVRADHQDGVGRQEVDEGVGHRPAAQRLRAGR